MRKATATLAGALLGLLGGLVSMPAAAVSLVTNGGFETGDFSGWTVFGDPSYSSVSSEVPVPQTGTYGASFGTVGSAGGITQSLATVAGTTYAVSFAVQVEADPTGVAFAANRPNSFAVSFGSVSPLTFANAPATAYTTYSYNLIATSSSTLLSFDVRDDAWFMDLDNVSVNAVSPSAVPEPGTWALMGLGLALVATGRRRVARRS